MYIRYLVIAVSNFPNNYRTTLNFTTIKLFIHFITHRLYTLLNFRKIYLSINKNVLSVTSLTSRFLKQAYEFNWQTEYRSRLITTCCLRVYFISIHMNSSVSITVDESVRTPRTINEEKLNHCVSLTILTNNVSYWYLLRPMVVYCKSRHCNYLYRWLLVRKKKIICHFSWR